MIALFIILMIPVLFYQVYLTASVTKENKHDRSLFHICQTRRNMVYFLREKRRNLSDEDLKELCQLLEIVGSVIHHFHTFKKSNLRFRFFKNSILFADKKVRISQNIVDRSNNPKIKEFQIQFGSSIVHGIKEHTPFFMIRFFLLFMAKLTPLLSRYLKGKIRYRFDKFVKKWNRRMALLTRFVDWSNSRYSDQYIPHL